MKDYKNTAFEASQMLTKIASFLHQNKGISVADLKEKEVAKMASSLMDDVRALYKS